MSPLLLTAALLAGSPAEADGPSHTQLALYQALSIRDPAPSCADLAAMSEDPVGDLAWLVEHADQPAWAGMRAATCLLTDHLEASGPVVDGWMSGDQTRGLVILVGNNLDQLPVERALDLAAKGLAGPHAAHLERRLSRSERPELRALVEVPSAESTTP